MKWLYFAFILCGLHIELMAVPAQIIIIRHGEKTPFQKTTSLAQKGKERAAALVPYFLKDPTVTQYGPPVAIYAQNPSSAFPSLRPIETVTPLAEILHLELNRTYKSNEFVPMLREIMSEPAYDGKMVLICWQRYAIPMIAESLGISSAPKEWRGKDFDRCWLINFHHRAGPSFQNIPQKLLYGDSDR
ncbi:MULTISPECIES: histidine phosphatase family protein [Parachlamydia]|jgi:hypothetical protein|uniref:Histidine phosphatase family protein n=2 Tax=Parachlamydia acanthamoebae TaxID=83552 RepID=F8KYR0_PARAV|nr:phosphoglycerate mutase family protein [Parachlamydia acanthamoebae]EFB41118.1 hypothetical protein pah_c050o082 [Parachlamydia acanthamoebae str. Hall's coccus]KIA78235.1 hypothetical protein DB43_EJ00060 [Parachlamydia acanthamoebae]CCB86015.1 putative uncharacterized protein [Parachlamydia acanthamoebae UV-7]